MARRRKKGSVHAHGCIKCSFRYEDACDTPKEDGLCNACRGRKEPWWPEARFARECCEEHARKARSDERDRYRLAGRGPWFLCPECGRTFPQFHPKTHPSMER